ncbi:MAG: AAA family ATPase [Methylobacter sp.]
MNRTNHILLTGHGEINMEILQGLVSQLPGVKAQSRVLNGNAPDFLGGPDLKTDVLIHFLGLQAEQELEALSRQGKQASPNTLIVYDQGAADAPRLMRLAMQAGARDFIMGPQLVDDALASIESLDETALMGYMAKHASGLHVLNRPKREIILPGEIDEKHLKRLVELAHNCYEQLVVDLPRLIDPVFNLVLEQADHILVVMQQELSSVRDAQRMIQIMTHDLGLPLDRITPVLNRYEHNNTFGLKDVERVLALRSSIVVIPNDFKNMHTASNLGVPIAEHAPNSPATKTIQKLAESLNGKRPSVHQGMFRKCLSKLLSGA